MMRKMHKITYLFNELIELFEKYGYHYIAQRFKETLAEVIAEKDEAEKIEILRSFSRLFYIGQGGLPEVVYFEKEGKFCFNDKTLFDRLLYELREECDLLRIKKLPARLKESFVEGYYENLESIEFDCIFYRQGHPDAPLGNFFYPNKPHFAGTPYQDPPPKDVEALPIRPFKELEQREWYAVKLPQTVVFHRGNVALPDGSNKYNEEQIYIHHPNGLFFVEEIKKEK